MGYGDFIPSGGYHRKKPLTKKQIQRLRNAYARAGEIQEVVQKQEEVERKRIEKEMNDNLEDIPL